MFIKMVKIIIREISDSEEDEVLYRECSNKCHNQSKSPYDKKEVPEKYFIRSTKSGSFYKTCSFCRKWDRDRKNKEKKVDKQMCHSNLHNVSCPEYSRENIPEEYLIKPNKVDFYKNCSFCRKYQQEISSRYNERKNKKAEEAKIAGKGKYMGCSHKSHINSSKYSPDKVPIAMFRKEKDDPNSILLKHCSDCRSIKSSQAKVKIVKKKENAEEKGNFFCTNCHKELPISERAKNLDGTYSIHCHKCKEISKQRALDGRDHYKDVKYQKMLLLESGCNRCNCVYIYEDKTLKCLETRERSNGRKLTYNDKSYYVKDFLVSHKEILEIGILELDHLTETEQRERGILKEDDKYIPKKKIVAKLSSRSAMDLEARKCQLLCGKCHLLITIEREIGQPYNSLTRLERQKLEYQRPIKNKGCKMCGYVNVDLPRFFHFDHINPEEKVNCVARMTKDGEFTMDELKKEIKKCQVLCMHCHKIHTRNQREKGIITNQYGTTRKLDPDD